MWAIVWNIVKWLAYAIAYAVITLVIAIILGEHIKYVLRWLRIPILPKYRPNIAGLWETTFRYESEGEVHTPHFLFRINQFYDTIRGENIISTQDRDKYRYIIHGKMYTNHYVTGTWRSIEKSDIHHGAMQFKIPPNGQTMDGQWVGFNRDFKIKCGPWKWKKIRKNIKCDDEYINNYEWKLEIDTPPPE